MKPSKVAMTIGIAPNTVRLWSNIFGTYLSTTAAGGNGAHRDFDDLDLRILYFIAQQKHLGRKDDAVKSALQTLQDRGWSGLPNVPSTPTHGEVALVPAAAADEQVRSMTSQLAAAQDRLLFLEQKLEAAQQEAMSLNRYVGELEGELKSYREAKSQQDKLLREVGELEGELKLWRSGRLKPD